MVRSNENRKYNLPYFASNTLAPYIRCWFPDCVIKSDCKTHEHVGVNLFAWWTFIGCEYSELAFYIICFECCYFAFLMGRLIKLKLSRQTKTRSIRHFHVYIDILIVIIIIIIIVVNKNENQQFHPVCAIETWFLVEKKGLPWFGGGYGTCLPRERQQKKMQLVAKMD